MSVNLSETQVLHKQSNIRKMLSDTLTLDYSHIDKGQCILRFYQMTAQEYEANQGSDRRVKSNVLLDYTLTVIFGDKPTAFNNCEGFCYDIRQLLKEGYITLDGRTAHVPVPLSVHRWNWLHDHVPAQQLKLYSRENGKLEYPLLHQELITVLKNIKHQPTVCSTSKGCLPIELGNDPKVAVMKLFDVSPTQRFGPQPKPQGDVKPFTFSSSVEKQTEAGKEQRAKRVIDLTKAELQELDLWVDRVQAKLFSKESQDDIKQMLSAGATEEQVSGFMIGDIIRSLLQKNFK